MLRRLFNRDRLTSPPKSSATPATLLPTPATRLTQPRRLESETASSTPDGTPPAPPTKRRSRRRRRGPAQTGGASDTPTANGAAPGMTADKQAAETDRPESEPRPPRHRRSAPLTALQPGPLERTQTFGMLSVSEPVRLALNDMGYETPTPIQEQAIPIMLNGRDVVGRAQTGTGKTTAFGIPMIELLDPTRQETQGLVLAPTRELAVQVTGELRNLAAYRGIKVVTLYGGQRIDVQLNALKKTPQIIVGTPGRVQDHMQRGTLRLNAVKIAILDEADQMLDIGFAEDMIRILRATPRSRQTALFSATVPFFIRRMIDRFLRDPVHIGIGQESEAADTIEQLYYEVAEQDKTAGLVEVLRTDLSGEKALIFCRTQVGVDRLARRLRSARIRVEPIHGGMRQSQREAVMRVFRSGELRVLVATNVAARGLDIPEISHVINYDMPGNLEEYIHRIGRTGRIGNVGKAVTFVAEDDFAMLQTIREHVGEVLTKGRLAIYAH